MENSKSLWFTQVPMPMCKVFVLSLLILVMPASAFAEKCSDRALSVYRDCLTIETRMVEMHQDMDLYSDWEIENVMNSYRKCQKFKEKRGRYADCAGRHRFGDDKWDKMFKDW